MSRDFRHKHECEYCEATFFVIPEKDECIKYCPQCGHKEFFQATFIENEDDEWLYSDTD